MTITSNPNDQQAIHLNERVLRHPLLKEGDLVLLLRHSSHEEGKVTPEGYSQILNRAVKPLAAFLSEAGEVDIFPGFTSSAWYSGTQFKNPERISSENGDPVIHLGGNEKIGLYDSGVNMRTMQMVSYMTEQLSQLDNVNVRNLDQTPEGTVQTPTGLMTTGANNVYWDPSFKELMEAVRVIYGNDFQEKGMFGTSAVTSSERFGHPDGDKVYEFWASLNFIPVENLRNVLELVRMRTKSESTLDVCRRIDILVEDVENMFPENTDRRNIFLLPCHGESFLAYDAEYGRNVCYPSLDGPFQPFHAEMMALPAFRDGIIIRDQTYNL